MCCWASTRSRSNQSPRPSVLLSAQWLGAYLSHAVHLICARSTICYIQHMFTCTLVLLNTCSWEYGQKLLRVMPTLEASGVQVHSP
jgi:hypothetical protein